jgi:UDP:flavonoid glycosyltransferase YjiC (YdhE family)
MPVKRVLFFAEAVTLAHVARPAVLATGLDATRYEAHLAHCHRYAGLLPATPRWVDHELTTIPSARFAEALRRGEPIYSEEVLRSYIEEDLALIDRVQPDVVVGDFRISLAVSAVKAGVPYVAISNAYWSPYVRQRFIVPELPMVAWLGPRLAQLLFDLARPVAFYRHSLPLNRVRKAHGLAPVGHSVQDAYTWADQTLYADVPALFEMRPLPDNHHFIGPILWSPDDAMPPWWGDVPRHRPIVYVTVGSSGNPRLLPRILEVLGRMDVTALVSTAGAAAPERGYDNVFVADFLPGDAATALASAVICNGGSPTTHQALAQEKPIIGIASNLDQFLNMQALQAAGAGRLLRADRLQPHGLRDAIAQVLTSPGYAQAAGDIAEHFRNYDSSERFDAVLSTLGNPGASRHLQSEQSC